MPRISHRESVARERARAKDFSIASIDEIMAEYGVDEAQAMQIACTTMDGAYETGSGGISARQTACHILGYDEALPESEGQKEGEQATKGNLKELFKRYNINPKEVGSYDEAIDLLMAKMAEAGDLDNL